MARAILATDRALVELVREGKVDAEIAVRLGLSAGSIEDRVGAVCRELGLANRQELAEYRGPFEVAEFDDRAEGSGSRRLSPGTLLSLAAGLTVAAFVGWQLLARDGGPGAALPGTTPVSIAPAAAQPAPSYSTGPAINGVPVQDAAIGVPESLPAGTTLLVVRTDSSSGETTIERVTQTSEGLVNAVLFDPAGGGEIREAVVSGDGGSMAASVCVGCNGSHPRLEVFRSDDSGANWRLVTATDADILPKLVAVTRDEVILDWGTGGARTFRTESGGRPCAATGTTLVTSWWGPDGIASQDPADGRIVNCRGRTMFDPGLPAVAVIEDVRPFTRPGRVTTVSWREGGTSETEYFVAAFSSFENGVMRVPGPSTVAAWRGESGFGTVSTESGYSRAVRFDFSAGVYHPLRLGNEDNVRVIAATVS